uniref:protein-serine/threonine phosphatase n=1 Tax=Magnolia sieboldii TaxID=85868 RepID=A0A977Q775_9MAGN|nr:ABA-hypersensitive germination 1 [Magnolia sieboldii]
MAEIYMKMATNKDTPTKCREARRRRMEMRRLAAIVGDTLSHAGGAAGQSDKRREGSERACEGKRNRTDGSRSSPSSSPASGGGTEESLAGESGSGRALAIDPASVFGSMSVSGRSRDMEDAISLRPDFYRPEVFGRRQLHFFAVFDGHGGSHVATLCQELMHVFVAEELGRVADSGGGGGSDPAGEMSVEGWNAAMARSFHRMDEVALNSCACGNIGVRCACECGGLTSDIVGSTAVVAVVGPDRIVVANCGDSRAVLCRGGRAIPLSYDHKPDRLDELARIEAAGGRVIYSNGARVLGILAMSRALGDGYLKPIVISEPEVNVTERTEDDECLILASDGLWDVLSNDMACNMARSCLYEGSASSFVAEFLNIGNIESTSENEDIQESRSRCSLAATLLTRLALGRKSTDNISVVVIDLRRV